MTEKFTPKFTGLVKDGKLTLDKQETFKEYVKSFEGKKVVLEIKRATKPRGNQQIRYYFGVVVNIVKDALNDLGNELYTDEVHDFLKSKFLFKEIVNESTGEVYRVPLSLSNEEDVTTFVMSEYIEKIQRWAADELGVYIPDPNENV